MDWTKVTRWKRKPLLPPKAPDLVAASSQLRPILDLPTEIIAFIFILCLPDENHLLGEPSIKSAPLLLTHVCRAWRQISHATPRLWNRLSLYSINCYRKERVVNHPQFIDDWLRRSENLPIHITLCNSLTSGGDGCYLTHERWNEMGQSKPILRAITPYASRCQYLKLDMTPICYPTPEWVQFRDALVGLQSADVDASRGYMDRGFELILPEKTPLLHSLCLSGQNTICYIAKPPWSQLTTLTVEFWDRDEFQKTVLELSSLEKLDLTLVADDDGWLEDGSSSFADGHTVLPRLREFIFRLLEDQEEIAEDVLTHLPLRHLRTLHLSHANEAIFDLLVKFVRRCNVTELELTKTLLHSSLVVRLFQENPQLKKLLLDHNCVDSFLLRKLTASTALGEPILVTHLTHFQVSFYIDAHPAVRFDEGILLSMVKSRVQPELPIDRGDPSTDVDTKLQVVNLMLPWELEENTILELQALGRSNRVQITLSTWERCEESEDCAS